MSKPSANTSPETSRSCERPRGSRRRCKRWPTAGARRGTTTARRKQRNRGLGSTRSLCQNPRGVARKSHFFESVEQLFVDQPQVVFTLVNFGVDNLIAEGIDSSELDVELSWHRLDNLVPQGPLDHPLGLVQLLLLNVGGQHSDVRLLHWDVIAVGLQVGILRNASFL